MLRLPASAIAGALSLALLSGNPMLDWPLQNQTSPTCTPVSITDSLSVLTTSSPGAPVSVTGSSLTSQFPVASAVADNAWPAKLTVTVASGSAVPKMGKATFRCSTMSLPNIGDNDSEADITGALKAANSIISHCKVFLVFMLVTRAAQSEIVAIPVVIIIKYCSLTTQTRLLQGVFNLFCRVVGS